MHIKPSLELKDNTYHIFVTKEHEGVHLHDSDDEAEIYLSAAHFDKIAAMMGYVKANKRENNIER